MAAGSTYTPIATTTLPSNATSIGLATIPGTYTDIVAILSNVKNVTAAPERVVLRVNGDAGSNYSETRMLGNGSTATSSRSSSADKLYTGLSVLATTSSSDPSMLISNFMNYSNTTTYKTILNRGSATYSEVSTAVGLWRSTSAITSVSYFWDGGSSFLAGTTLTLYGIAKA